MTSDPTTPAALIATARSLVHPLTLSRPDMNAATVGCALCACNNRVYHGVCIHLSCGLGFCAEAAAMANMVKDGETRIRTIVAAAADGILSPCGRCREMMVQVDSANLDAAVILSESSVVSLRSLLPAHWLGDSDS
ncbi:MAG: cytidine deaminase family protein [Planctomycetota bacterium]